MCVGCYLLLIESLFKSFFFSLVAQPWIWTERTLHVEETHPSLVQVAVPEDCLTGIIYCGCHGSQSQDHESRIACFHSVSNKINVEYSP